jgi:ABC-type uncharacterized transport system involved in gliding motility auxiliary subunit
LKNWIKGTNAVVLSLAVIGIFIVLTIFLHSLKGVQWDLSKNKNYTLSEQTTTTLKQLNKDVHVIAFTDQQGTVDPQITDMLAEYHKRNSKLTYEEVDPTKKPTVAQQYNIKEYGAIIFESGGKTKTVSSADLFTQGDSQNSYNFNGEEKFTQAIVNLISGETHAVYFVTGHGEQTISSASALTSSLESQGYGVKDLNLLKETQIPADAETLFVLSPTNEISDKEAKLIEDYLKGKGKLIFSLDIAKDMETWKNWDTILKSVGIKNQFSLAVESKSSLSNDPFTIIPDYGTHDITSKLQEQQRLAVLPGALALTADTDNKDVQSTVLLKTSDQSYGITNLSLFTSGKSLTQEDIKQTAADVKGPLNLAFAIQDKDSKPKAIVIGNGIFMQNDWLGQQGNRDFTLNSLGWLQEQKNQLTIRPRVQTQAQQIMITPGQARTIQYLTLIIIPLLILLLGGGIWWRRRKG